MGGRSLGPVTAGSMMGAAVAILIMGAGNRLGLAVTADEANALVVVGTGLGGLSVRPRGLHER